MVAVRNDLIEHEEWIKKDGKTMLPKARKKFSEEGLRTFNFKWPEELEVRTRLKDFLENEVSDKYYLDEEKTKGFIEQVSNGVSVKEATKIGYSIAKVGDAVNIAFPSSKTRRGRVGNGMANTLEANNINQGVVEKIASPIVAGSLEHYSNDQMNRVYSPGGISPTITVVSGGGREQKLLENKTEKYVIRKFTPRECLRLQSVEEKDIDIILENFSDSKSYKFAGNGLTTNVIKAIGKEIRNMLEGLEND